MSKTALITGANRGLGLETARQLAARGYKVFLGSRDKSKGEEAASAIEGDATAVALDTSAPGSWGDLPAVDVLVNNAGIAPDPGGWGSPESSALKVPEEFLLKAFRTNTLGPYHLCQRLIPGMMSRKYGRVVNVSSGMGQLIEMNGAFPSYRLSKTALNALTRIFSQESNGCNVKVNSVCPGWVRTDMGGESASRSLEEGAAGIVWAATLPDDGPSGGFFRDGEPIPW